METTSPTKGPLVLRRALAPLAALALLLLSFGLVAAPASAHDTLIASTPADGETLTEVPTEIVLTYNNEIATIGAEVQITAPSTDVVNETPTVEGTTATVPLGDDVTSGTYSVAWRVTSSDGHPIEGTFTFTLDLPAPDAPTAESPGELPPATESATPVESSSASAVATESATETAPAQEPAPGSGLPTWVLAVLAVAMLGSVVAVVLRLRRDRAAGQGPRSR